MKAKAKLRLHFVGIGGIGMSGIAEVFFNQGYQVTGSDLHESDTTRKLMALGIRVNIGHSGKSIVGASVVVISSAVRDDNPEVVEAKRSGIPVIPRAEMLGELMRGKTGIAVAGTHGKTTTTSLLASILTAQGLDPTLVIGGLVNAFGGNAKLGGGEYVVAEADESDGSFLHLPSTYSIITNIDTDHLDYYKSLEAIENAFVEFSSRIPFYGVTAVCGDDPGVKRILSRIRKPFLTYGFSDDCDWVAQDLKLLQGSTHFTVKNGKGIMGDVALQIPGKHNVLNSLGALAIANELQVPFQAASKALSEFQGVSRRFEIRKKIHGNQCIVVDDYAHHPTEILATLSAARQYWPKGRIVTVFQPHRYTRTLHSLDGFLHAFRDADVIAITDIYAAGEDPIPGVSAQALVERMAEQKSHQQVIYVGELASAAEWANKTLQPGDLFLSLGAGSITKLPDMIHGKA